MSWCNRSKHGPQGAVERGLRELEADQGFLGALVTLMNWELVNTELNMSLEFNMQHNNSHDYGRSLAGGPPSDFHRLLLLYRIMNILGGSATTFSNEPPRLRQEPKKRNSFSMYRFVPSNVCRNRTRHVYHRSL